MFRILLFLICTVALGMCNVDNSAYDEPDETGLYCIEEGFEDDLCFDALAGSIHLDLICETPYCSTILYGKSIDWREPYSAGLGIAPSAILPLRAPPMVG